MSKKRKYDKVTIQPKKVWEVGTGHHQHLSGGGEHDNRPKPRRSTRATTDASRPESCSYEGLELKIKFEGDFEFENLPQGRDRQECIEGALANLVINNPEEFLDIIFQHDIIVEQKVPRKAPVEGAFGFYTGR